MKKFVKTACLALVICLIATMPVSALEADARANTYIAAHATCLEKEASTQFKVWFDVTGSAIDIDMIGVRRIVVYRSADQQTWTKMRTYNYTSYPQMMDYNSGSHSGYVTYSYATPGYYYRAYVTFYAENSSGSGTIHRYTEILKM